MPFDRHPLVGSIDMHGFEGVGEGAYRAGRFFEFQMSVFGLAGRGLPVSGGGYVRLLPWLLMRQLIVSYLKRSDLFVWYAHPFELSPQPTPPMPAEVRRSVRLRFGLGRASMPAKFSRLVSLLSARGFRFTTFSDLRRDLLGGAQPSRPAPRGLR